MSNVKTINISQEFDQRPWGSFTVLDETTSCKVKRLEVLPGKRLSYQKHKYRSEHWFVVEGEALVTLDGEEIKKLFPEKQLTSL